MTTTIPQSPVEPPLVLVNASVGCFFFVSLTNQSLTNDQPKPTLVGPELDQQQLRSSPTVVQHDFQEPDTARCFDLSGRFQLGRVNFGGPTQLGALVTTRLRIGLVIFAAPLPLGRVISARTLLYTAVTRGFPLYQQQVDSDSGS